jgi:hypothetical protein
MAREFFRFSIGELEALFKEKNDNLELLIGLKEELTHRKTERAAKLQRQVVERLSSMNSLTPVEKNSSSEIPVPSPQDKSTYRSLDDQPKNSRQARPTENTGSNREREKETCTVPQQPLPPITNRPDDILCAWTALEVLSPPAFKRPEDLADGDRRRVSPLRELLLPWERGEASRKNYRLYYQVVLGSIRLEPAVERLLERYGDTRPEKPSVRGEAALAIVAVDNQGRLVESPAVGISSFGWGVIAAIKGELADLAKWSDVEPRLASRIERNLLGQTVEKENNGELRKCPLKRTALLAAYHALTQELELPQEWIEPPDFAIRSYVYYKDPNPPEPLLLNSFFLADLSLARKLFAEGKAPQNLRRYLGAERPEHCVDLLRDISDLAEAVSPGLTPLARWPGPGRYSHVLLQQAAVNLAFRETKAGGLVGINGPPGTGKTTLLRDLVAGVVTARAEAMAKCDDPEAAFMSTGKRLRAGNSWIHLYRINKSLRGFEMVVASSNNKAVENVSAELPGLDAIASDAPDLRYLKTLSDTLHESETWGAIAAVLGNSRNRSRFKQVFWWDEDNGLNTYLRAALGSVPEVEAADPKTGRIERRTPHIVVAERPPSSHEEALGRWNGARKRFRSALDKSHQWQVWLEGLRNDLEQLPVLVQAEADAALLYEAAAENVQRLEEALSTAQRKEAEAWRKLQDSDQELHEHGLTKPGFLARLVRTRRARVWSEKEASLRANHHILETQHIKMAEERRSLENMLKLAVFEKQNTEAVWQAACSKHQQIKQCLIEAEQKYGVVLADANFFAFEHARRHQMTPWFPPIAQRLRDDVFISAVAVHRAFMDAAARPLRHNLSALMNAFTTQTLPDAEKQELLPDLWASLFLVIPLVSTTFASVHRMLGKLPLESLGWLLVDEAGQALPQAAVGALMRTQRSIIVGDPMQIEPVVVLPDVLTSAICRRFGVAPDQYAAPLASVQTLADAASRYASEFQTQVGGRSVGVPLLVHRRCSEPMFGISNAIAYSGLMVSAKSPRDSVIKDVLGPSRWIHIEGSCEDKWCREEGAEAIRLLYQIAQAGAKPDLYIITPFVIVEDRLRKAVCESGVLKGWVDGDEWRWANERIGTVHTAQGREAEAVILVLGAPHQSQTGARGWAGGRPNLLNVAVTRAKEVIYVIGNRQLWREAGLFRELDKRLP